LLLSYITKASGLPNVARCQEQTQLFERKAFVASGHAEYTCMGCRISDIPVENRFVMRRAAKLQELQTRPSPQRKQRRSERATSGYVAGAGKMGHG
jgi:hypothetical protein